MSVYQETEDVDQGNRVLLFCVGADVQRRRDGANTAVKTRAILQLGVGGAVGGIKGDRLPLCQ